MDKPINKQASLAWKTDLLSALFIGALVLANTLGGKITTLAGVRVSVGIFFVPILFLVTDVLGEVHGRTKARNLVIISVLINIFSLTMIWVSIKMPPNPTWGNQDAFAVIFGSSLRMTFASLVAFAVSQLHDVWTFDFIKKKTGGKHLWLRNNVSTMVSQLIDSTIFMFVAFYGISEKFTVPFIISLIIPYWFFKIIFALLDTPLCYLLVRWLKGDDRDSGKTEDPAVLKTEAV
jgi:hypothetical protein